MFTFEKLVILCSILATFCKEIQLTIKKVLKDHCLIIRKFQKQAKQKYPYFQPIGGANKYYFYFNALRNKFLNAMFKNQGTNKFHKLCHFYNTELNNYFGMCGQESQR